MVFLVLMYSGHFFWMAYWKQLWANPLMDCAKKTPAWSTASDYLLSLYLISCNQIYRKTYYLISVVHSHSTTPGWKVIHLPLLFLASISRGKHDLKLARLVNDKVCGPVLWDQTLLCETVPLWVWIEREDAHFVLFVYLISKSMSANCYRLCPSRNETGNVFAKNWLTENGAAQDVPNGSVGTFPHLL